MRNCRGRAEDFHMGGPGFELRPGQLYPWARRLYPHCLVCGRILTPQDTLSCQSHAYKPMSEHVSATCTFGEIILILTELQVNQDCLFEQGECLSVNGAIGNELSYGVVIRLRSEG